MNDLITLDKLPAGSTQLPRPGKPLSGWELSVGLVNLVDREVGEAGVEKLREVLANEWWNRENLVFPRARVDWSSENGKIWVRLILMGGKAFEWSFANYDGPFEHISSVGPCDRPDDLREALGLPVVVKFRDRDGNTLNVRLDEAMAQYKPQGVRIVRDEVVKPDSGADPVVVTIETPVDELVAEPPRVPLLASKPVAAPVATRPQGVVLKGVRK